MEITTGTDMNRLLSRQRGLQHHLDKAALDSESGDPTAPGRVTKLRAELDALELTMRNAEAANRARERQAAANNDAEDRSRRRAARAGFIAKAAHLQDLGERMQGAVDLLASLYDEHRACVAAIRRESIPLVNLRVRDDLQTWSVLSRDMIEDALAVKHLLTVSEPAAGAPDLADLTRARIDTIASRVLDAIGGDDANEEHAA